MNLDENVGLVDINNSKWKEENKKIAVIRNAEPFQSDISSGDVASISKGAPTVIKPRQLET